MSDFLQPWEYLEVAAQSKPGAPALVSVDQVLTFANFANISARMARVLRTRGIGPGDVVALNLPNQMTALFSWAVFHEAAISCAFQPFLLDSEDIPVALVVSTVPVDGVPLDRLLMIDADFLEALDSNPEIDAPRQYESDDDIVRFTFTSGTTGRPKAIALTVEDIPRKRARSWSTLPTDGGFAALFPTVDGPGWGTLFACVMNAYPYFVPGTMAEIIALLQRMRPKHLRGAPRHIAELASALASAGISLDFVETVDSVGGTLPREVASSIRSVTNAKKVTSSYSATEVGAVSTPTDGDNTPNYVGTVLPSVTVEIVDPDTDAILPNGAVGLVRIATPDIVAGYFRDPEATAESFRHDRFYPGDLGRLENGKLYIEGRLSEMINSGGLKTDPNWVDEQVMRIDGIDDCATFALMDAAGLAMVATAVVTSVDVSDDDLRAAVVGELGSHSPRVWVRVDAIPRNALGKPIRRELTERFSVGSSTES